MSKRPMGLVAAIISQFVYDEIQTNVTPDKHCLALARIAALLIQALKNLAETRGEDWRAHMNTQLSLIDDAISHITIESKKKAN